ncbi:toll/interleukin-1 receptor domain-containing protein [Hathewaya limosa]|uniref:TIR domain-containing protein n=2 Tax=Hathewaya limosa TaxID=1536 RepID=A0ABU0JNL8_HATLI|nr:toll/interleukin-1 receptor domain-containing protein [Hathewaya limosa]MDQ0478670.1 hypothetical protein [Hathewaya limosa]
MNKWLFQRLEEWLNSLSNRELECLDSEKFSRFAKIEYDHASEYFKALKKYDIVIEKQITKCPECGEECTIDTSIYENKFTCEECEFTFNYKEFKHHSTVIYKINKQFMMQQERKISSPFNNEGNFNISNIIELSDIVNKKKNENLDKGNIVMEKTDKRLFISHAYADRDYTDPLVELLHDMGIPKSENSKIFYSSKEGYGIPLGMNIYDYLKKKLSEDVIVFFVLSNEYYKSTACLNEMGATWIGAKNYYTLLLPDFEFSGVKGGIDPMKISFKIDNKDKLTELKDIILEKFNLGEINSTIWENSRDKFLKKVSELKERDKFKNSPCKVEIEKVKKIVGKQEITLYTRFINNGEIPVEFTKVDITLIDSDKIEYSFELSEELLLDKVIYSQENRREEIPIELKDTKYNPRNHKSYSTSSRWNKI